eukprot:Phypoly_transcript_14751.p1 GENE.Phypoly_transcript_14751~~Phypoly_transcript_14751.p1  ORF type:complete len:186 (+),score=9.38 Phypoly_transcript_14751:377-934(+)
MEYKPEDPLQSPKHATEGYSTLVQPPTYNVLANGQVQMIYNMPPGIAPPSYQYPYPEQAYVQPHFIQYPTPLNTRRSTSDGFYVATLVTFIVGLFTYFPYLVSLILTFIMVNKGYVSGARKAVVLTMAIIELIAWLFCASFAWYTTYFIWLGWTAIVFWFVVALSCGIPRVIFLRRRDAKYQQMQ